MAPVQGGLQRLVARQCVAGADEKPETVGQPLIDLLYRQHADSCCGQFDGQRDAVHAQTDRRDGRRVAGIEPEIGTDTCRTIDEKAHRFAVLH